MGLLSLFGCSTEREEKTRLVYTNQAIFNHGFVANQVSNTKYTFWSFIPKNLFEQFGRFMNLYFLMIAMLQWWSVITPVSPVATWAPLLFIFFISALKEFVDDYKRHVQDRLANLRRYLVLKNGQFVMLESQQIMVGDILKIQCDEEIPCDIVVISTSEEDGTCYIQTSNLDGETDLKLRQTVAETRKMKDSLSLSAFKGMIECAIPNAEIYKFDSRMKMSPQEQVCNISLSEKQLLLQATHLRNTEYAVGVAVYTGNETKIGMNRTKPPVKWTKQDSLINKFTFAIFIFQLSLVFTFGLIGNFWEMNRGSMMWYLRIDKHRSFIDWIIPPLRFLLLNSMMIPISLKVTLDIVKYLYAKFIDWDERMFDPETEKHAVATSTAISEDLGQIEYIFTDKTGTLTENKMMFSRCTIRGTLYGARFVEDSALDDPKLRESVEEANPFTLDFFRNLALCHSVVISKLIVPPESHRLSIRSNKSSRSNNSHRESAEWSHFKASSPDEEALVKAAAKMGIVFTASDSNNIEIEINGVTETYEKLFVLEFTSERKRMSVIVKNLASGRIRLFTKGADEVILPRLYEMEEGHGAHDYLEKFAREGLRTLCIAQRDITEEVYHRWVALYNKAATSLEHRTAKLGEVYDAIEKELTLVGTTAIEDKLQENVPDTIQALREAHIRIWMLTGDKYSTAVEIATSCNLISSLSNEADNLLHISGRSENEAVSSLLEMNENALHLSDAGREIFVIIEGLTLQYVVNHPIFADIGMLAHTVICCRVTPQQKAQVVAVIKNRGKRTLAIGDGGNDVSMIYEAHVGVGIAGREGLQASRSADYSIGKFYFLKRLILLHGRWSYIRTSFIAQYCFYKSLLICLIQLLFAFHNGFSGSSFFNTFCLTAYNIVFTGVPILFHILDRDSPAETILNSPSMYLETQSGSRFSAWTYVGWVLRAFFQAAMAFYIPLWTFSNFSTFPSVGGESLGGEALSMVSYTSLIFINTWTIITESSTLTFLNHLVLWGTISVYFILFMFLSLIRTLLGVWGQLTMDPNFWLSVGLTTVVTAVPISVIKLWNSSLFDRESGLHKKFDITGEDDTLLECGLFNQGNVLII
eukprot:TRINITY_DN2043_c0_g1_i5.p1 TRINITY_DN2043_c0_g1~~TRINITY_DN2043_c0_g1_i5.p1  ORF type:complete len:1097 (+),score=372.02 TRINITY_DN2043_c0_g1_i5:81-3371(+)